MTSNPTDTSEEAARAFVEQEPPEGLIRRKQQKEWMVQSLAALLRERERAGIERAAKVCADYADKLANLAVDYNSGGNITAAGNAIAQATAMKLAASYIRALLTKEGT